MADVVHGAFFDFAFFLGLGHVAGNGGDLKGPEKFEKLLVEAHQGPMAFEDGGEHVVMYNLFGGALEEAKGIEQAAVQGFLSLGMRKLQIEGDVLIQLIPCYD